MTKSGNVTDDPRLPFKRKQKNKNVYKNSDTKIIYRYVMEADICVIER